MLIVYEIGDCLTDSTLIIEGQPILNKPMSLARPLLFKWLSKNNLLSLFFSQAN